MSAMLSLIWRGSAPLLALALLALLPLIFAAPRGSPQTQEAADRPLAAAGCTRTFSDVKSSAPYYKAVMDLACGGLISGYADGSFRPAATLTRAQAVKVVVLA